MSGPEDHREEPRVVVNDKRRIDPTTGEVRSGFGGFSNPFARPRPADDPADPANAAQPLTVTPTESEQVSEQVQALQQESAERLADLQRVTAEYANYRKRVDRDRTVVVSTAKGQVLIQLLTVLDDIDRADAHGDLTGAFKAVADKLTSTLQTVGLVQFGAVGDVFDPAHHEAVHFDTSPDVTDQRVSTVMRHGYSYADRVVRAAVVAVTGPSQDEPGDPTAGDAGVVDSEEADTMTAVDPGSSGGLGGVAPDGGDYVGPVDPPSGEGFEGVGTPGHPEPDSRTADPDAAPGDSGGAGGVNPDGTLRP